ncbi:MAG: LysR family transcriptional regulator [Tardiphaga sp.]
MLHHDLQTLRLFVAICELRSLSRAAERTHLALSAASRRLKLFEEELGVPLVRRLPHGLEVTSAGITAERYALSVLHMADRLAVGMDEHRSGVRGRIRVCASSSALMQRLAGDLADFARDNPDIKIDLEERPSSEILEALDRKQADVGVIVRGPAPHSLDAFPYTRDRLVVAVAADHPLAARTMVAFADLFDEEFVALESGSAVYRLIAGKAFEADRILNIRVQVRTFVVMCQMVQKRLGIGILPETAMQPVAHALGLKVVTLSDDWAVRNIDVVVPAMAALDAPTARLVDWLHQVRDFA